MQTHIHTSCCVPKTRPTLDSPVQNSDQLQTFTEPPDHHGVLHRPQSPQSV